MQLIPTLGLGILRLAASIDKDSWDSGTGFGSAIGLGDPKDDDRLSFHLFAAVGPRIGTRSLDARYLGCKT